MLSYEFPGGRGRLERVNAAPTAEELAMARGLLLDAQTQCVHVELGNSRVFSSNRFVK
jgi:hypothetical protein